MGFQSVILASASPRRGELLRGIVPEFHIVPSAAVEILNEQLTAREMAQINAHRKARSVARKFPDALVLGFDTIVYHDHVLYGKPADLPDAQRMLECLEGRTHEVVTGVCLLHLRAHREKLFAESTLVTFKALNSAQICAYLGTINPLDKAGGYAIQENGDQLVREFSGSRSNVVGLPVERLRRELTGWI